MQNLPAVIVSGLIEQALEVALTAKGRKRRTYKCSFISAGYVKMVDGSLSNKKLTAETLQASVDLFEGVPSYMDHPAKYGFGAAQNPSLARLIGITSDTYWDNERQKIMGNLTLYDEAPGSAGHFMGVLLDTILTDKKNGGEVPPIGLSAVFFCKPTEEQNGDIDLRNIRKVQSVDLVYSPGADGYVEAALAEVQLSLQVEEEVFMPEDNETTMVSMQPAEEQTEAARADDLDARIEQWFNAHVIPGSNLISGNTPMVTNMNTGLDRISLAFEALLDGVRPPDGIRPLTGIKEFYLAMSGDYEMHGVFQKDRVELANVTVSTMAGVTANALNKRLVNAFQTYPQWWAPAVTVVDFATMNQAKFISLGGVPELATVAEGAAYVETTWDDQTETADFVKKGNYLGITLEAIDRDDVGAIQRAPQALAQGAWMTLGKAISAVFTANSGAGPAMSDTYTLFDATNHNNLSDTALSAAAWSATKVAMMKQSELNSGERLGALTRPHFLWVPIDLEETAIALLASGEGQIGVSTYQINVEAEDNDLVPRLNRARDRVITVPFWTDTNNWAAQAHPSLFPSLGLGFRYGRTPEIFVQASNTEGLMFTNDTMPIKVRFIFAVGPTDWRGLYKHNVT